MATTRRGRVRIVNNLPAFINGVERKAAVGLLSSLAVIGSEAAVLIPIASSTLINSQYRDVSMRGTAVVGRIGFTAEYALAVHEAAGKLVGMHVPRPKDKGKDRGYYWGPHEGQPHFLTEAARRAMPEVRKRLLMSLGLKGLRGLMDLKG